LEVSTLTMSINYVALLNIFIYEIIFNIFHRIYIKDILRIIFHNPERCNSISLIIDLSSRDHQFEFHKPYDHYRLIWSLTSGLVGLVEVRASLPGHPY